jgi:hypothetical protein
MFIAAGIGTAELSLRPSRAPDFELESRTSVRLAAAQTGPRDRLLQGIADAALGLCCAGSAGIIPLSEYPLPSTIQWLGRVRCTILHLRRLGRHSFESGMLMRGVDTFPVVAFARDAQNPCAAVVSWLGATEPSRESSFFGAMQKFVALMQLVLPDQRPGVFVKRDAVQSVTDFGTVVTSREYCG